MKTLARFSRWLLVIVSSASLTAAEQQVLKLSSVSSSSLAGKHAFGRSIACTEKHVLVGSPNDDTTVGLVGAVHVYDAKSGKRIRTLRATDQEAGARFGSAVAISGNYALIGAPGDDNDFGSAYILDVSTGKQILKILSTSTEIFSDFGQSVALEGNLALVGARQDDTPNGPTLADAGSVSFYRIDYKAKTATLISTEGAADTAVGDEFGTSLALSGGLALIGAPGHASDAGAAYLYNAATAEELDKWQAADAAAGDRFGTALDIHGDRALIGAPQKVVSGMSTGAAYEFDVTSLSQFARYVRPDPSNGDRTGEAVAISNRTLIIAAPGLGNLFNPSMGTAYVVSNGDLVGEIFPPYLQGGDQFGAGLAFAGNTLVAAAPGTNQPNGWSGGAAYLFPALSLPVQGAVGNTLLKTKDSAPGAADASLKSFSLFHSGASHSSLILANLTGSGAPAGKTLALYADWNEVLSLRARTGDFIGPLKVTSITQPVPVTTTDIRFLVKGSGAGITSANDQAIIRDDGTGLNIAVREGDAIPYASGFNGQKVKVLGPPLGNEENFFFAAHSTLATGIDVGMGIVTVTSANDSCVFAMDTTSAFTAGIIEGKPVSFAMGPVYGQIPTRIALDADRLFVTPPLTGAGTTTADNSALVRLDLAGNTVTLVARKGDPIATGTLSSVLGEAVGDSHLIFRTSLKGPPSSQNEALCRDSGTSLVLQEGIAHPDLPVGVLPSKFIRYFACADGAIILLQLRGTGVTTSNDIALVYKDNSSGDLQILLREGDTAPDSGGAKVGVIQTVDVDAKTQDYVALVSLTGSLSSSNQALYRSNIEISSGDPAGSEMRRRPALLLRKGTYQTVLGKSLALTGIKLNMPIESSGAGSRGLGRCTASGGVKALLTFSGGVVQACVLR